MQIMKIDGHAVCAPDTPIRCLTLATILKDWIALGGVGDGHGLLFGSDEWPAFVQFVNEIDEEVRHAQQHP